MSNDPLLSGTSLPTTVNAHQFTPIYDTAMLPASVSDAAVGSPRYIAETDAIGDEISALRDELGVLAARLSNAESLTSSDVGSRFFHGPFQHPHVPLLPPISSNPSSLSSLRSPSLTQTAQSSVSSTLQSDATLAAATQARALAHARALASALGAATAAQTAAAAAVTRAAAAEAQAAAADARTAAAEARAGAAESRVRELEALLASAREEGAFGGISLSAPSTHGPHPGSPELTTSPANAGPSSARLAEAVAAAESRAAAAEEGLTEAKARGDKWKRAYYKLKRANCEKSCGHHGDHDPGVGVQVDGSFQGLDCSCCSTKHEWPVESAATRAAQAATKMMQVGAQAERAAEAAALRQAQLAKRVAEAAASAELTVSRTGVMT